MLAISGDSTRYINLCCFVLGERQLILVTFKVKNAT